MRRFIILLGVAALLAGCKLVSSEGKTLIRLTPDHTSGCANHGDASADAH